LVGVRKLTPTYAGWIYHLILNALPDNNLPRQSLLIGEDGEWRYQPLDPLESQAILITLLTDYYWQGLL
jgi:hypothetical protein